MTKKEARMVLVKHLLIPFVVGIIVTILIRMGESNPISPLEVALYVFGYSLIMGGLPFGWKWANTIITAVGLWGIFIKFLISLFLGWVALPVTLIKDIITIIKCPSEKQE